MSGEYKKMHWLKDSYLMASYIIHVLCEWFLCIYAFIIPKKFDIFYTLYILLLIVLKCIFKYECIINYFDKRLIDPNYKLGSDTKYVPYERVIYKDNSYLIFFINCLIILNLAILIIRNKSVFIKGISAFNIVMWLFIEYTTQDYYRRIFS